MIFLRKISVDDTPIISEIHQRSFTENWSQSSFKSMLMDPNFFGFLVGRHSKLNKQDIACGFILARKVFDEIEIITFCVLPEHRRKNFGKLLMVELIKQSGMFLEEEHKKCDMEQMKIFLEVADNNIAAINLYRSFGFEKISKRTNYYKNKNGDKIDANVMALVIGVGEE